MCIYLQRTMAAVEASQHQNMVEKDGKREALAAVISAKRELLKHSLEMMVKQVRNFYIYIEIYESICICI
jgi:hypothetical protein